MEKFKIGNVVRSCGSLIIITDVRTDTTSWVSFSHSNASGVTPNVSSFVEETCYVDLGYNSIVCENEECTFCNGTGEYKRPIVGMDEAILVADNVKDYIMSRLTKNFDF